MLLLNRANKVLGITTISEGGLSGTVTDVRLIYQYAIKGNASGIIVCHNHPSGNQNPSESDLKITQKIKEAGNLLDIQLLDHIILTPERDLYRSFADEGQL
jgi:DNA repair protein RadC